MKEMTKTFIGIGVLLVIALILFLTFTDDAVTSDLQNLETTTLTTTTMEHTDTASQVTLQTNHGNIVLELYSEQTPKTVANFVTLAKQGYYDQTKFHRVISDFMIQGGDPLTKDDTLQARWGTGGPGYTFEDEIVPSLSNVAGTISMANAGPNTNGSQFFINVADNTFLDGKHAVFGKVIEGYEIVEAISELPRNNRDVPNEPVVITAVVIAE